MLRGSSLAGLCCMKPINGYYVRPLLSVYKKDLELYLAFHNIKYLVDPTNEHEDFLRNAIRKRLIPLCKKIDLRFDTTFSSMLTLLKSENDYIKRETKKYFYDIFNRGKDDILYGNKKLFVALDDIIQKRLIIDWLVCESVPFVVGKSFIHEIIRYINLPKGGRHQICRTWSIGKKGNCFWIIKKRE